MECISCHQAISPPAKPLQGLHAECFCREFSVDPQTDFRDLFERTTQSGPRGPQDTAFKRNSSFFHGRYRKYSGTLAGKNYILKMQQAEFPELPVVEHVCNQLARVVGIQVPDFHFIHFENQAYTFLSRNLMDNHAPATLDHVYKFLPADADLTCEHLCEVITKETGRLAEVHKFVEICLFDSLIGNNDRHGRNLAFITKGSGNRSLSPFYDNPSYIGVADPVTLGTDLQPRGAIFTSVNKEPRVADYISEFRRMNLGAAVDRFCQRALTKSQPLIEIVRSNFFLSAPRKNALIQLLEKRLQDFKNA